MHSTVRFHASRARLFAAAMVAGAIFGAGISVLATSVGTNISVDGTLTSTGNATMSGTLTTTGAATFNGNVTLGDAAVDAILSTGMLNASSTLAVTGVTNHYGNINVNGFATTTASNGNIATEGSLGVGTSTPGQELGVNGDVLAGGAGTTTLYARSATANTGGCIELLGTDGVTRRIYVGATTTNTGRLIVEAGACK